jgi:hypothetical protein
VAPFLHTGQAHKLPGGRPSLQLEIKASCNSSSGRCTLDTYNSSQATIDMTKDPLSVKRID